MVDAVAGRQQLGQLLRHFPPVAHAFAYGSGVMHQPGLYPDAATTNPKATSTPSSTSTIAGPNLDHLPTPSTTSAASTAKHDRPMLDLIFAVPDARAWHRANIAQNPEHYAWLARSVRYGPDLVAGIAEVVGVGVHFNTLVPLNGAMVKYGVMELSPLVSELSGWRQLFLAGRLHKPVHTLQACSEVQEAQAHNLRSALAVALLQLPGSFTTHEMLRKVCGLSYSGDVRMGLAEDPHKVDRIVQGSRQGLEQMYLPLLRGVDGVSDSARGTTHLPGSGPVSSADAERAPATTVAPTVKGEQSSTGLHGGSTDAVLKPVSSVTSEGSDGLWRQDMSYGGRLALLRALPVGLLHEVSMRLGLRVPESHLEMTDTLGEITAQAMVQEREDHPLHYRNLVSSSLTAIVRRSSAAQAVAGALAAGGGKAVEYLVQKLRKAAWVKQLPFYIRHKAKPTAGGRSK